MIKFGGLPNVIIPIPEINSFEIKNDMDFIIMGCKKNFTQAMGYSTNLVIMK
jgi:hypothetical protein